MKIVRERVRADKDGFMHDLLCDTKSGIARTINTFHGYCTMGASCNRVQLRATPEDIPELEQLIADLKRLGADS